MPIRILDATLIAQIAAGEVIERPYSVVKELLENSLDAGATSISIEMRDGGAEWLRVTDNGCGMSPGDAKLAFENHATSKIREPDDLLDLRTFGFRGEALASIASAAKVDLMTRRKGADFGFRIRVEGGKFIGAEEIGCPEGTTILVKDLFFNLPARRAFLKKPSYESGLIEDMVAKMILGNPDISIRVINSNKTKLHSYGDGNLVHAALAAFGPNIASQIQLVDQSEGALRIHGLVGLGSCARPNRNMQSFYINGRLVRCPTIAQAFEDACKGRIMAGMHPICALSLTMPAHLVDVNVHPSKLEVRFRDEAEMRQSAFALFERMLEESDGMLNLGALHLERKEFEKTPIQYLEQPRVYGEKSPQKQTEVCIEQTEVQMKQTEERELPTKVQVSTTAEAPVKIIQQLPSREPIAVQERMAPAAHIISPGIPIPPPEKIAQPELVQGEIEIGRQIFRMIGVAFNTYLFIEVENSVLVIDQHAAHERLLYEKYQKMLENNNASQQLLAPAVIQVSKSEYNMLIDNQSLLFEIGYEIEPFGDRAIQLRSVPHVLGQAEPAPVFMEMLDTLDNLRLATLDRRRIDLVKFCCKRAVKAGDRLNQVEIEKLLSDMVKSGSPPTCPHGRPVIKVLTRPEIERFFKR